jgi:hypothetical protein
MSGLGQSSNVVLGVMLAKPMLDTGALEAGDGDDVEGVRAGMRADANTSPGPAKSSSSTPGKTTIATVRVRTSGVGSWSGLALGWTARAVEGSEDV